MLKKALFVASAAIALSAVSSLPASAAPTCPVGASIPGCPPKPVSVPEPTTLLGLLSVGGVMAAKKMVDSRKASK